jgi:hypothetical protein
MFEAIQNIVDAYVRLGDAKALEELKAHRQGATYSPVPAA